MYKLLIFWLLLSCRTFELNNAAPVDSVFFHDIPFEINGIEYPGLAVVPYTLDLDIYAKVKHKFDYMSIRTLNREIFREDRTRKLKQKIRINPEVENGLLIIDVGLFNVKKTQHYWGKILLLDQDSTLGLAPLMICNGERKRMIGTTACQARAGKVQTIIFKNPMVYEETEDCSGAIVPLTEHHFEVGVRTGVCVFRFREKSGVTQHRLLTLGYNKIFFREILE